MTSPDQKILSAALGWLELGNPIEAHNELETLPPILVPLGTNVVTKGAAFFNPANSEQGGTILESDNAYEFPDGSIKPGLLIKSKTNGVEVWVAREKMMKVLVERAE